MSWHFSQGMEEASWAGSGLDGAPDALLSLIPGPVLDFYNGSAKDTSNPSPSGTMSSRSTDAHGAGSSTSSAEGSPARTSASLEEGMDLTVSGQAFGGRWRESLARYDRRSSSWRIAQCSELPGRAVPGLLKWWVTSLGRNDACETLLFSHDRISTSYSDSLPKWGTMLDGVLWELPTPAELMAAIVYGSSPGTANWPTPTCANAYLDRLKSSQQAQGSMHSVNLCQAVNINWATPTVHSNYNRVGSSPTAGDGLDTQVKADMWPTPAANEFEQKDIAALLQRRERVKRLSLNGNGFGLTLGNAVRIPAASARPTPTPTAHSATGVGVRGEGGMNIQTAVQQEQELPRATPVATAAKGSSPGSLVRKDGRDRSNDRLDHQMQAMEGGQLNPSWVEALMCWPIGWTSSAPMEVLNWPWAHHGCFVAGRGRQQHEWEPPRTARGIPHRGKRIKAVGNGQDPSALLLAVTILSLINDPSPR